MTGQLNRCPTHKRLHSPGMLYRQPDECVVDDLIIAAQYAFSVPTPTAACQIKDTVNDDIDDDNEIDLEEAVPQFCSLVDVDEISTNKDNANDLLDDPNATELAPMDSEGATVSAKTEATDGFQPAADSSDVHHDDGNDDAESDVDLAQQLACMAGEDEYEDAPPSSSPTTGNNKPMTANEIDAYQADMNQLQNHFQWNVSLDTELALPVSSEKQHQWTVAGSLRHHMVEERTVVILSAPGAVLLQEGSLLAIQRSDIRTELQSENLPLLFLLGKIFEVFGPVSQPLYSIRLPPPARIEATMMKNVKKQDLKVESSKESEIELLVDSGNERSVLESCDESKTIKNDSELSEEASSPKEYLKTEPLVQSELVSLTHLQAPCDLWSKDGLYTKLLGAHPDLPVYYLQDNSATNVLDTAAIYRNSGRGCDASNVFDEEIMEVQDYSDDEQERMSKGQHKKKGRSWRGGDAAKQADEQQQYPHIGASYYALQQEHRSKLNYARPPQLQGFHPNQHSIPAYLQNFNHGMPPYSQNAIYPTPYAPRGVAHPTQYAQQDFSLTMLLPPQAQQSFYYDSFPTAAPPPPPPPGAPQQQPPHEAPDTVYYDFR